MHTPVLQREVIEYLDPKQMKILLIVLSARQVID